MELPKKHTQNLYIIWNELLGKIDLFPGDMSTMDGYVLLGRSEVTVDIPPVDITGKRIETLEAKRTELVTEYETKLHILDERIQELRALPAPE